MKIPKPALANSSGKIFSIYKKRCKKGAQVMLGNNGVAENGIAAMYTVAAIPATTIEPAYDLKPVISYKAVNGNLQGRRNY
jgi:hypothetical protein